MKINNYQDLIKLNPEGLVSSSGHYLERPENGWGNYTEKAFIGVGYLGSEIGDTVLDMYAHKLPRFNVDGMNQAEFIQHIAILCFNQGYEYRKLEELNKQ